MTTAGWIFMIGFWAVLLGATAWSYKRLLREPHIPEGPMENDYHPLSCDLDEEKAEEGEN